MPATTQAVTAHHARLQCHGEPGLVAAWLAGIIVNLLPTYPGHYDIALRDSGLMLAALTLARLASLFDPPINATRDSA